MKINPETVDALLYSPFKARKTQWIETVEKIDLKCSSKKTWNLLRRIDPNKKQKKKHKIEIKPNAFVNRIIELYRAKIDYKYRTKVKTEPRESKSKAESKSIFVRDFTNTAIATTTNNMKSGKTADFDIYLEFI